MKLIPYSEFSRLRLKQFLSSPTGVKEHDGFEWMGGVWRYEGVGFTWFGQLEGTSEGTGGIELCFEELVEGDASRILRAIGLPVAAGFSIEQLNGVLGPNYETRHFVNDRITHVFRLGTPDVYEVSCTVESARGLTHVSVIRNDLRRSLAVA